MAFIRSERNAFGRLSPDALPEGVEIIDEAYAEVPDIKGSVDLKPGEIIQGESTILEEAPPIEEPTSLLTDEPDLTPITESQVNNLKELLKVAGKTPKDLGDFANKEKAWGISAIEDLQKWQYTEIINEFLKEPAS